jgi:hypothetical protein
MHTVCDSTVYHDAMIDNVWSLGETANKRGALHVVILVYEFMQVVFYGLDSSEVP